MDFTVCILEDDKKDINTIKKILIPLLKAHVKDIFKVNPSISIKAYQKQSELKETLLNDSHIKKTLKLFILDYFLDGNDILDRDWFTKYFPAVPTIILT
ncbi:MAG: hypothetical protein KAK00_06000, partial [Nanoarchaeota archaeon]|nr:hypothetical protein [Nanoarchaeota archaeon]